MSDRKIEEKLSKIIRRFAIAMGCVFFIFLILLIRESAIIPGLDQDKDDFKKYAILEAIQTNCHEGMILDRNGESITLPSENYGQQALIKDGYAYSYGWILGTSDPKMSLVDGIRATYAYELYDDSHNDYGSTIQLTIDSELQRNAYIALDQISDDGSIMILENNSGAIRAFATRGSVAYNGNDQAAFSSQSLVVENAQYMRGIYEQDAPASVFKLVTLACAIENGIDFNADDLAYFEDDGTYEYSNSNALTNYKGQVYGTINVQDALNYSVNTYFAYLADKLGKDALTTMYEKCMLNQDIIVDFRTNTSNTLRSSFDLSENEASVSHSGIGQGKTMITPLHLASIIASFANDGEMMQPYMVEKVDGSKDHKHKPKVLSTTVSKQTCNKLNEYAHQAALSYGFSEAECGWVCAKTGTAEFENAKQHSYLVAYNQKYTILISCNDIATSNDLKATMKDLLMQVRVHE